MTINEANHPLIFYHWFALQRIGEVAERFLAAKTQHLLSR